MSLSKLLQTFTGIWINDLKPTEVPRNSFLLSELIYPIYPQYEGPQKTDDVKKTSWEDGLEQNEWPK